MERNFLPNLKIYEGDISEKVIVCGDPKRAAIISEKLDNSTEVAFNREYRIFNGDYKGTSVSIISHGVGCPGAAVCFEEMIKAGAKEIIRVGTAGSYTDKLPPGSLIIANSAAREEGLTKQLVPLGMPAISDMKLTDNLEQSIKNYDVTYGVGTIVTLDVFYNGVIEFPHEAYKNSGALGAEMELASLLVISKLRNVKATGIFALDGYAFSDMDNYDPNTKLVSEAIEKEIFIALDALVL